MHVVDYGPDVQVFAGELGIQVKVLPVLRIVRNNVVSTRIGKGETSAQALSAGCCRHGVGIVGTRFVEIFDIVFLRGQRILAVIGITVKHIAPVVYHGAVKLLTPAHLRVDVKSAAGSLTIFILIVVRRINFSDIEGSVIL